MKDESLSDKIENIIPVTPELSKVLTNLVEVSVIAVGDVKEFIEILWSFAEHNSDDELKEVLKEHAGGDLI